MEVPDAQPAFGNALTAYTRLAGKTAIVTGAASGMGAAIARCFCREGATVIVADVLRDEGQAVADELAREGCAASYRFLDIADENSWTALLADVTTNAGIPDVLVNNAGIMSAAFPDKLARDGWDKIMGVNATGTFLGMRTLIPAMTKAGRGSIVNIASIAGNIGQAHVHLAYNASKGAIRLMTKAAAVNFGSAGIRVNSVHPGVMPPMRTSVVSAARKELLKRIPLGREGRVDEVASAVLFLASDEASYITGAELHVDGGFLAG